MQQLLEQKKKKYSAQNWFFWAKLSNFSPVRNFFIIFIFYYMLHTLAIVRLLFLPFFRVRVYNSVFFSYFSTLSRSPLRETQSGGRRTCMMVRVWVHERVKSWLVLPELVFFSFSSWRREREEDTNFQLRLGLSPNDDNVQQSVCQCGYDEARKNGMGSYCDGFCMLFIFAISHVERRKFAGCMMNKLALVMPRIWDIQIIARCLRNFFFHVKNCKIN